MSSSNSRTDCSPLRGTWAGRGMYVDPWTAWVVGGSSPRRAFSRSSSSFPLFPFRPFRAGAGTPCPGSRLPRGRAGILAAGRHRPHPRRWPLGVCPFLPPRARVRPLSRDFPPLPLFPPADGGKPPRFRDGFGHRERLRPQSGASVSVLGHAVALYTAALFFASGAHRTVIRGLFLTFDALPPGADLALAAGTRHLVSLAGEAVVGAVLLTFPFLVLLFFIDLTAALLARAVPQLNLFVHGLPLKLLAGNFLLVPFAGFSRMLSSASPTGSWKRCSFWHAWSGDKGRLCGRPRGGDGRCAARVSRRSAFPTP